MFGCHDRSRESKSAGLKLLLVLLVASFALAALAGCARRDLRYPLGDAPDMLPAARQYFRALDTSDAAAIARFQAGEAVDIGQVRRDAFETDRVQAISVQSIEREGGPWLTENGLGWQFKVVVVATVDGERRHVALTMEGGVSRTLFGESRDVGWPVPWVQGEAAVQ